jgi:N-acetylglutamate synthase-like GNAT family acetyltransferase
MINATTYPIRIAGPPDLEAVGALLVASYASLLATHYEGDMLRRALPLMTKAQPALLASGSYYVAESGQGDLVGCGGWTTSRPGTGEIIEGEAHIRHFATHPEWVRRGVASSLLSRCLRDAQVVGIRRLYCFSTLNAEGFYRASGFETIESIDVPMGPSLKFPGVLMRRELY